jgi:hypothetical protein
MRTATMTTPNYRRGRRERGTRENNLSTEDGETTLQEMKMQVCPSKTKPSTEAIGSEKK